MLRPLPGSGDKEICQPRVRGSRDPGLIAVTPAGVKTIRSFRAMMSMSPRQTPSKPFHFGMHANAVESALTVQQCSCCRIDYCFTVVDQPSSQVRAADDPAQLFPFIGRGGMPML